MEAGQRRIVDIGGLDIAFRWIPPGRFRMGSPKGEAGRFSDEGPQHKVTIPQGFWLGEVPVTQALYEAVTDQNPSHFKGDPRRPVERVSWSDAVAFCARLGPEWRLPTEAEWEYACRADTQGPSYAPAVPLEELGWYYENSQGSTQPVGLKRANTWGLHDMLGNVWEWCWNRRRTYTPDARTDTPELRTDMPELRTGARGLRVFRGGSWLNEAQWLRPASRYHCGPGFRCPDVGFRIVYQEATTCSL